MQQSIIDQIGIGVILNKVGRCPNIKVESQTGDNRENVDGYISYKGRNYFFQLKSSSTYNNTLVSEAYFDFAYKNDVLIYFYVCNIENEGKEELYFSLIDKNWISKNYIENENYYLDIPSISRRKGTNKIKTQLFSVSKFENEIRNYFNKNLEVKRHIRPGTYDVKPVIAVGNIVSNIFNENIGAVESFVVDKERFPFKIEHECFSEIFLSHNSVSEYYYEHDGKTYKATMESDTLQHLENDNKAVRYHIGENIIDIILSTDDTIEFQIVKWSMTGYEQVISFFKTILNGMEENESNFIRDIFNTLNAVVSNEEFFYFANLNSKIYMFCNIGNGIYRNVNPNGIKNFDIMGVNVAYSFIEAEDDIILKIFKLYPNLIKSIVNEYSNGYYFSSKILEKANILNINN